MSGGVLLGAAGLTGAVLPRRLGTGPLPGLLTDASWRVTEDAADAGPRAEARWLAAGRIPGEGTRWEDMVRWALVDLRQLLQPSGAGGLLPRTFLAGPDTKWRYSWPRDCAFAAVALSRTGHRQEALTILEFLATVQRPDGGFEARYLPDGSTPDAREPQSDGAGWALWALAEVLADAGGGTQALRELRAGPLGTPMRPLLDRATGSALALTGHGRRLPPVSSDYWERQEWRLTLGTVAPLLAGLRAAARTHRLLGARRTAAEVAAAADRLEHAVHAAFADGGYQRYASSGGRDAAVCFLMPPFTVSAREEVVRAWRGYQREAIRPAGGLAPGAGWRQDGISWTPEVALVAYAAAASGDGETARRWLEWLDAHRVEWGSLPEKVLPDGSPAGPAPLGWTAATVVLTVNLLERGRGRA